MRLPDEDLNEQIEGFREHLEWLGLNYLRLDSFSNDLQAEPMGADDERPPMAVALVCRAACDPDKRAGEVAEAIGILQDKVGQNTPKLLIFCHLIDFNEECQYDYTSPRAKELKKNVKAKVGKQREQDVNENFFLVYKAGKSDQMECFLEKLLKELRLNNSVMDFPESSCISQIIPDKLSRNVKKEGFHFRNSLADQLQITGQYKFTGVLKTQKLWKQKGWDQPLEFMENKEAVIKELGDDECYENAGDGSVLIISNRNFKNKKHVLKGTDIDALNLKHLFERLGFTVDCKKDLDAKAMKNELELHDTQDTRYTFADSSKERSCYVVAIITHGNEGSLLGVDENWVKTEELVKAFSEKPFAKKPRLLIIMACRGNSKDSTDEQPCSSITSAAKISNVEYGKQYFGQDYLHVENSPEAAGLIVAHSTLLGQEAWIKQDKGSRFITALCMAFHDYAKAEDILCLINRVNTMMTSMGDAAFKKQLSSWTVQTTRKFYLLKTQRIVHDNSGTSRRKIKSV